MSDVLVKGMEMPKEPDEMIEIAIFGDGKVIQTGESWRSPENGKCYYTTTNPEKLFNAVPIPPHGRLIDADALLNFLDHCMFQSDMVTTTALSMATNWIKKAPTIIPAEEGE